jgi:hypothetical protein
MKTLASVLKLCFYVHEWPADGRASKLMIRGIDESRNLSHSHTIPLSLFYYGLPPPICHWPTSSPIVTHSPLVGPVHIDAYITCCPFVCSSLITLMMEAVRTSAVSVNIYLTRWQYIPEDSKLNYNLFFVMYKINCECNKPFASVLQ